MAKKRAGILFGGKSVEHEVSLQSARNGFEAVDPAKFDVVLIGIDKAGQWHVCEAAWLGAAASPSAELAAGTAGEALALVPGGTYALSGDLVVSSNSTLYAYANTGAVNAASGG